ncbi:DUF1684 domain-containing protein [Falsarthrobacter nasiphocae]|uniref:Uncharacterized protein (DUF1684 family) n=1 Tax=Falsarthrobacter nasiphocae TaxID=189863 RepID=A0AAE3YGI8_9MICC|nr:DUF1684 domain-containing protein [Falsarthrobacter nasiphocae]MDR6891822.1 uncharacterized protein (DUF1684 family) [Falsarthrobacter nasiphocae]
MPALELTPEFFTPVVPAWASPEEQEWASWRGQRLSGLHAPHGWLTVASYEWLPEAPGRLESVPGLWSAADGVARVEAAPGLMGPSGEPFEGGTIRLDEGSSDIVASFDAAECPFDSVFRGGGRSRVDSGLVQVELGVRGGRYMVRTRRHNPELAHVPTFPFDPAWVVSAVFEPLPVPYTEHVETARADTVVPTRIVGTVRFHVPGLASEVVAAVEESGSGAGESSFSLTFRDATSGTTTPAWRFVTVRVFAEPSEDGWAPGEYNAVIDFNRALDYPMAFTPFAVCPAPVAGNTIPAPVTAGEKALPRV